MKSRRKRQISDGNKHCINVLNKIRKLDDDIIDFIDRKMSCSLLDYSMKIVTFLGDFALIWIFFIVYLLKNGFYIRGIVILCSLIVTIVLNEFLLKNLFKRNRPIHNNCPKLIINIPKSYSFPSGHTATAFSVASLICLFSSGILAYISLIFAIIIGFSRIYIKAHYLSDVLVGAFVGTFVSTVIYLIYIFQF